VRCFRRGSRFSSAHLRSLRSATQLKCDVATECFTHWAFSQACLVHSTQANMMRAAALCLLALVAAHDNLLVENRHRSEEGVDALTAALQAVEQQKQNRGGGGESQPAPGTMLQSGNSVPVVSQKDWDELLQDSFAPPKTNPAAAERQAPLSSAMSRQQPGAGAQGEQRIGAFASQQRQGEDTRAERVGSARFVAGRDAGSATRTASDEESQLAAGRIAQQERRQAQRERQQRGQQQHQQSSAGLGSAQTEARQQGGATAVDHSVRGAAKALSTLNRLFSYIEVEGGHSHRLASEEPCPPSDQRKALTALLLSILVPPAAHIYYGYVVLGTIQIVLYALCLTPLCFACGWFWRPTPKKAVNKSVYDSFQPTIEHITEQSRWLIILLGIAGVTFLALLAWQVTLVIRIATSDFVPANGCPASNL